jgi:hypothetical protein
LARILADEHEARREPLRLTLLFEILPSPTLLRYVPGTMYDVLAFDFDPSRGFTALKSSILGKLRGVDGEAYDKDRKATKAVKAKATSVVEVKARLRVLGIPQTGD